MSVTFQLNDGICPCSDEECKLPVAFTAATREAGMRTITRIVDDYGQQLESGPHIRGMDASGDSIVVTTSDALATVVAHDRNVLDRMVEFANKEAGEAT